MIKDIVKSIQTYFKAIKVINELKLWKFFLIPTVIGLILGLTFISTAFSLSDNLGNSIAEYWTFDFGKSFVMGLSSWIAGFLILILGIILYKHILMALSAPFMTPVSEKVESYLTGKPIVKNNSKKSFVTQLARSIRLNTRNLLKELAITLPLMLLSLIPVVGIIAVILIFYFQSFYTGFGNMDYTLERHLDYKESKLFIKKNKGLAIGNGAIFTAMLLIPFVGIMLTLPISTVASTIDTVERLSGNN